MPKLLEILDIVQMKIKQTPELITPGFLYQ